MCQSYPHLNESDATKRSYIFSMLSGVKQFIQSKHKIKDNAFAIQEEGEFHTDLFGQEYEIVKPDILVSKTIINEDNRAGQSSRVQPYFLMAIECKFDCPDRAVEKCVKDLAAASHENRDHETAYGFCSDGTSFSLLSYEPVQGEEPKCELSPTYQLMFPLMFKPENVELWKREYTKIILVFYTIICNKLGL